MLDTKDILFDGFSFSTFSDVLPNFTCVIGNFWNNIFKQEVKTEERTFPWIALYLPSDSIEEQSLISLIIVFPAS